MVKVVSTAPSKIRYKRELITPARAQKMLDSMKANTRKIKRLKRDGFARDMAAGRWQDNGETLKETPEGECIDGLHRLSACVKADVAVEMTIAYNVPLDAMPTIDTGSARTFGDVLKFAGESNPSQLAAIIKRLLMWRLGYRLTTGGGSVNPSHSEQELFFNSNAAECRLATARGHDARTQGICNATSAGAAFFLFAEIDYNHANTFFDGLVSGENLSRTNPIHVCRQRLIREADKARNAALLGTTEVFSPSHQLAMVINAWNFWRADQEIESIWVLYAASGKPSRIALSNDNFPEPK